MSRSIIVATGATAIAIALAPPITAVIVGVGTSFHQNVSTYADFLPPSIVDARSLLATFRYKTPDDVKIDNKPLYDRTFMTNPCLRKWMLENDGIEFVRSIGMTSTDLQDYEVSIELEKQTTPFGRGFFASCLLSPLYASLCYPHVREVVVSATKAARPSVFSRWKSLYGAAERIACADLPDG